VLFPIGDEDKKRSGPAFVMGVLILLNVGAFWLQLQDPEITYSYGLIPYEVTQGEDLVNERRADVTPRSPQEIPQRPGPSPIYLTLLTSMFLHGGWLHLGGNMLYLWIFGDNVEHRFGHGVFILFYLVSGLAAAAAQIALAPESLVPMIGASGAISGVLGAYLVLFPRNRVHAIFFFRVVSVPAFVALGLWIVFQLFSGYGALTTAAEGAMGGVAYAAHIGGFFAGAVLAMILRFVIKEKEHPSRLSRAIEQDPDSKPWW
jgi:membrane associated rhomboid family serine protease